MVHLRRVDDDIKQRSGKEMRVEHKEAGGKNVHSREKKKQKSFFLLSKWSDADQFSALKMSNRGKKRQQ